MSTLEIRGLRANVGDREILRGIDLTVPGGEVHVVMGPNGSGKSTLSHVLMGKHGYTVTGLNDQHCHLTLPEDSPLAVGDLIAFDISHPCTTFDKWQLIHVIDEDHKVVEAIRTFF